MKSIKPGRGPSMLSGIVGIAVALFGVFWTITAAVGGAWFMAPFGIIFTVVAVVQTVYNFKNAAGKNRYSEFDITDSNEEPDPWNEKIETENQRTPKNEYRGRYCPYCGEKNEKEYKYCTNCGRELPD